MSFLLSCPGCGPRDVYEFRYGGEARRRPSPGSAPSEWGEYLYARANVAGVERAWWFHRSGCRRWFLAERDTRDNHVLSTAWPARAAGPVSPRVEDPPRAELPPPAQGPTGSTS